MSPGLLIQHLRELLVHEWLSNQGEYRPFFDGAAWIMKLSHPSTLNLEYFQVISEMLCS